WVMITDQTEEALYPSADADEVLGYPSVCHHNGDDARGLIYITDTDTTMLDVIGIPDEDPGKAWDVAGVEEATAEHTLVRKNHIITGNTDWAASAGTDTKDSEWMVYDQNFFDSLGMHTYIPIIDVSAINLTGEGGATTIETDKGTLQITAEVLPADASDMSVAWSVSDITLASISETGLLSAINDGVVTVTVTALDGSGVVGTIDITNSNQTPVVPVASITVSGAGGASEITENGGSLQMEAVVLPADATDNTYMWSLSDSSIASIDANGLLMALNIGTVTVTATAADGFGGMGSLDVVISNQYTEVADLTALKALDPSDKNSVYKIVGEVIVTYAQSYRNIKFVQDAAGGVKVDDSPGNISTAYNVGDGMTGVMGTIEEYNGMLQFHPVADPGAASTTGNEIVPLVLTPAELITDHDLYESRVVVLESVNYVDADGVAAFENGKNYDLTDMIDTLACRVDFYDTDLTGMVIPDSANVTGITIEYKGTVQLAPRSGSDVEELIYYMPSDDASITDLLVDDVSVVDFTPAQLTYYVELPQGTATVPVVTAVTNNDSAVVTVTDASDLGGTEAERTSTVLITAEDMVSTKTYDVVFTVAVGIAGQNGASFEIYPIPADRSLHVRSMESLMEMRIISITGSTVRVKELSGEKNIQLDISELESGVYFLKLSGDTSSQVLRFVKN
ncbi:MAG: Ig-like domain-containing protein, partial [Bacteroides sp.]|nr:Ig-like domain-containing protein [Bacteroides sp.]